MIARLMGLETITPRELDRLVRDGAVTSIDVNSRQSWATARVPGARHLDAATYGERDLPGEKDAPLVFYCSNAFCRKAPHAARRALAMGHRNVRVLSSGISGWLGAGLPTESGDIDR